MHPKPQVIRYTKPDIFSLRSDGYYPVDMHLHTNHSDGLTRVLDLLDYAAGRGIGVAITDHNEISGSLEAIKNNPAVLVIPGIELETLEGPHLLFYFYTAGDMQDFFTDFSRERTRHVPELAENLPVMECLHLAESYECVRIAAHPFGYYGINRGVLKCIEKQMLPGAMDHIEGIEVICGGMIESLNRKAMNYARTHQVPYTGGSDAHILPDVGNVVTAVQAESVEDFLHGILKRENQVIGKAGNYVTRGATAGVIAWSFVPFTYSFLKSHYSVQKRRTSHMWSSYRNRMPFCMRQKKEDSNESEERGKESRY